MDRQNHPKMRNISKKHLALCFQVIEKDVSIEQNISIYIACSFTSFGECTSMAIVNITAIIVIFAFLRIEMF